MTDVLEGLKVLDLSWVVAGPLIGRALADFGAEVIRVESTRRPDTARLMQPFQGGVAGVENSALYGNCNAGKLGLSLDLSTEAGRAVVSDLAGWADVVLESFSPGQMRRWGLDQESLRARYPGLIVLSSSLMGQTGPYAGLAGFGATGGSLAGFQDLVGRPDELPVGTFGPYTDYLGPRLGLVALLAALERREATGQGCYLDVSQVEAGAFLLSPYLARYTLDGSVAPRRGNRDEVLAPHGVYPCREEGGRARYVAVVVRDEADWQRLAEVVGRPDLAADPGLRTVDGRRARQDELDDAVAAWTAQRTAAEAEEQLQAAGVPAHRSASSADCMADPQLAERGHFVRLPHPAHGETVVEGPRYLLSETPGSVRRPAPAYGQDNDDVLRRVLGYSDERIDHLVREGVLV